MSTRTTAIRMLVLTLLLGAVSCSSTRIVIADADRGERSDGQREMRLLVDRVKLSTREVQPQLCFDCALEEGAAADPRSIGIKLQFFAINDLPRPWELRARHFELESALPERDFEPVHTDTVVASIPPFSTARFSVWLTVRGLGGFESDADLYGDYRLRFEDRYAGADGTDERVVLERHLSVGEFNQAGQFARFLAVATLGLVALAAL